MRVLQYTKAEILNGSKIGFEFEFLSKKRTIQTARELSNILGVKVVVPINVNNFLKPEKTVHSSFIPSSNVFKLEKDNSGGSEMKELITGPLSYNFAKNVLIKTLKWIDENGETNSRTSLHLNISFDDKKIAVKRDIEKMNILKMCLDFDEDFIYDRFPSRKNNEYSKSIKNIVVNNIFYFGNSITSMGESHFIVPNTKYFGINFLKHSKNYLEFRQIGGRDYQKKEIEILEILHHNIFELYRNIMESGLNSQNMMTLNGILNKHQQVLRGFKSPATFVKLFPKIKITANLNPTIEVIKTHWFQFRDKLIDLVIYGGMDEGQFNYDSDFSTFQLKSGLLDGVNLKSYEFINCNLKGEFNNCMFYECEVEKSIVTKSKIISDNKFTNSKIIESPVYGKNKMIDCYIDNKNELFNGETIGGVFRSGKKGEHSTISKETKIVE